jgi:hypothetical protein
MENTMIAPAPITQDFLNPMNPKKPKIKESEKVITEEVQKSDTQKSILG